MLTSIIVISITLVLLVISLWKDKKKTVQTVKNTGKMIVELMLEIIGILALVSLFFTLIPDEVFGYVFDSENAGIGTIISAGLGSITILPGVVAFPLAKQLFDLGALVITIAAFITTLTMVGLVTAPIEIKYFGKKFTLIRNLVSFVAALCIAVLLGVLI
jgi:hypothetical protein